MTELNSSVQRCLPRFLLGIPLFKGLTAFISRSALEGYSECHMKDMNALYGQCPEILNGNVGGKYHNQCVLEVFSLRVMLRLNEASSILRLLDDDDDDNNNNNNNIY
jgi:hypothetical protein